MKAIVCEMCNGNDLVKQDGLYVCQNCGTKYTIEEAKKLLVDVEECAVKDDNSASEKNTENNSEAKPIEIKKKSHKKINKNIFVIAGLVIVVIIGAFVGVKLFNEYRKTERINNSANEIANTTWKSIDSDKQINLNKNGGSYGEYKVSEWIYKAPVLNISYKTFDLLSNNTSDNTVSFNLSFYQDDILQLTGNGSNGECFVKESDYATVTQRIRQAENDASSTTEVTTKETKAELDEKEVRDFLIGRWQRKRVADISFDNFSEGDTLLDILIFVGDYSRLVIENKTMSDEIVGDYTYKCVYEDGLVKLKTTSDDEEVFSYEIDFDNKTLTEISNKDDLFYKISDDPDFFLN